MQNGTGLLNDWLLNKDFFKLCFEVYSIRMDRHMLVQEGIGELVLSYSK